MKKLVVILGSIFMLSATSCVKQKNCDCAMKGKFVYFEEPKDIIYCGYERKVNAVFIQNNADRYIISSIPNKFRVKDTINVSVCLKEETKNNCRFIGESIVFKIKCIRKED